MCQSRAENQQQRVAMAGNNNNNRVVQFASLDLQLHWSPGPSATSNAAPPSSTTCTAMCLFPSSTAIVVAFAIAGAAALLRCGVKTLTNTFG
jgi:hypothetical protein